MRGRGQRATTIEARSGILRHLLHVVEAELTRLEMPLVFAHYCMEPCLPPARSPCIMRCLHEAPDLDGNRQCFLTCLSWITSSRRKRRTILENRPLQQLAKTNRAVRTKTTITGQHYYDEVDLVDYHRPTTTKDDRGGWKGPFQVARNDPDRGRVIVRVGNCDVQ
eukprot:4121483-Pyramimonas_sp.AAC.1